MTKFMDKHELVLIALLILIFDFNGFCNMVTTHIPYKDTFSLIAYSLSIIFLSFDIYVFHYVIKNEPSSQIDFAVHRSEQEMENKTKTSEHENKIELEESIQKEEKLFNLSEKIVVNFIAIWITIMIVSCLYFTVANKKTSQISHKVRSISQVILLLIPLVLLVSLLSSFANIYLNIK